MKKLPLMALASVLLNMSVSGQDFNTNSDYVPTNNTKPYSLLDTDGNTVVDTSEDNDDNRGYWMLIDNNFE